MAKLKKSSKKFLGKVHNIVENDIFKSVSVASVLLNILFIISLVVLTSTSTFDHSMYKSVKNKYCSNVQGVRDRKAQLGDEKAAIDEWEVNCVGNRFAPFYKEAIEKFKAQNN